MAARLFRLWPLALSEGDHFTRRPIEQVARDFRIGDRQATAIRAALPDVNSLGQLGRVRGVGQKTLANLFAGMREPEVSTSSTRSPATLF